MAADQLIPDTGRTGLTMRRIVARIGRAHGIRGEVSIEVRTDAPDERFAAGAVLHVTPPARARGQVGQTRSAAATSAASGTATSQPVLSQPAPSQPAPSQPAPSQLTVSRMRDHNGTLLLTFDEVSDRTGADAIRDHILEADIDLATEETDEDAWYDEELVGLQAVSPAGAILGTITALDTGSAQDRLVVRRPDGAQRLVPFVRQLVPEVDIVGGRVVIDAPPGLIDEIPLDDAGGSE